MIVANAAGYSYILAPATSHGKNTLPRVAALLDVAQISDIVAVEAPDTFVRPIYAGNALATVKSSDAIKVITVRTTAFDAAGQGGAAAIEEHRRRPRPRAGASSSAANSPSRHGRNWAPPRSSSPAGAAWPRARITTSCWSRWPTSSMPRSAPRAPPSMPASSPTTIRSARPARSSRRSSTSPSASRGRSSIWPA